jgi:asparagine N-glycosylation enzyme membrane subunit Stt3
VARAKKREKPGAAEVVEAPPSLPGRRAVALHLAAASLVVVLAGWQRFAIVRAEAGGRFEDPDAMFHAHRVERTIAEGRLFPPVFDARENFPEGGRALWPPFHDATLALLARIGGSTAAEPRRGFLLAAAFPVVEMVLSLLAAAALAGRAAGPRAAVFAAWLFALTPAFARRGSFGDLDHNLTEVLAALLLLLLADLIARREETGGSGFRDPRLSPLLWGGALLLALGFYAGLVLTAGVVALAVAARDLTRPGSSALPRLSLGFGLAALALPFFATLRVAPDLSDPWRLGPVFVLLFALGAAGTGLFSLAATLARTRGVPRDVALFAGGGTAAGLLAMLLTSARAWPALLAGLGFLGSRDPWLATIDEFLPVVRNLSWAVSALPAVAVAAVALAFVASRGLLFLAVPFAIFTILGVIQVRFVPLAAAFAAAAGGVAWALAAPRRAARIVILAVFVVSLIPAAAGYLIPSLRATLGASATPTVLLWDGAAAAIRTMTPAPADPPGWGVLAPWDYGHAILWKTGRPVALNNFGNMHPGFARAQKLWLEPSPAAAVRELSRLKLRYVLVVWPPYYVPSTAACLGLSSDGWFEGSWTPQMLPSYRPTPTGERVFATRLHLRGTRSLPSDSPEDRAALLRLRPVWNSEESLRTPFGVLPLQRLFELLPDPSSASR